MSYIKAEEILPIEMNRKCIAEILAKLCNQGYWHHEASSLLMGHTVRIS